MQERAVNIFADGDEENVIAIGFSFHTVDGTPSEVTEYLRSRVSSDYGNATQFPLANAVSRDYFNLVCRSGPPADWLMQYGIDLENAIYCITHIVDGAPMIDKTQDDFQRSIPDYLILYTTENGFDFPRLLNDDYMESIKILWNQKKYISALKLLLSMVDTIGFIEFGPTSDCFCKWLDQFCDLSRLGIESEELWELRNSLLHMSNLDSRKVRGKSVARLVPVVTAPQVEISETEDDAKVFHVSRFMLEVFPRGIEKWLETYNTNPEKFATFVARYDSIVSEARMSLQ